MPKTATAPHKVTVKFWDQDDRIVYLRLPHDAHWFICTSAGSVDDKMVADLFRKCRAEKLPPDARPVFTMTKRGRRHGQKKG